MMTLRQLAEYQMANEIRELGFEMVHLDTAVQRAISMGEWADAGAANAMRMQVQLHRSNLLYDQWTSRRVRRRKW